MKPHSCAPYRGCNSPVWCNYSNRSHRHRHLPKIPHVRSPYYVNSVLKHVHARWPKFPSFLRLQHLAMLMGVTSLITVFVTCCAPIPRMRIHGYFRSEPEYSMKQGLI